MLKYHIENGINSTLFRAINKVKTKTANKPMWAFQPSSLQLDTTNKRCTLNCVYCNPQNLFVDSGQGDLPLETIDYIVNELKRNKFLVNNFYPFMNSDPLLETRLPAIVEMAKKALHCSTLISTNGVLYSRRHLLADKNINDVCFTVSAATNELYEKIHGKPLFDNVLATISWLKRNKHWNQRINLRYILFGQNLHELESWKKLFSEFNQEIRCLHCGGDRNQSNTLEVDNRVIEKYRRDKFTALVEGGEPCNCFGNLAISYDGRIMQCCDLPYEHNWGHVEEVDLAEVWNKRLDIGLDHPGCRGCVQKNPHWRELFEKFVWN